jgi:hypothetical protein
MTRGLVITNTKFTHSAKKYAKCVGTFDMIGWDYPKQGNLYDLIADANIMPITALPTLSQHQKEEIIKQGVINCAEIQADPTVLDKAGIKKKQRTELLENIDMLCSVEGIEEKK